MFTKRLSYVNVYMQIHNTHELNQLTLTSKDFLLQNKERGQSILLAIDTGYFCNLAPGLPSHTQAI